MRKDSTNYAQGEEKLFSLSRLDLGPIRYKLHHEDKIPLLEVNIMEKEYRMYLELVKKYPNKTIVPTKEIDTMWHAHILDTQKYREDCRNFFGYFVDHFPYFGLRGDTDKESLQLAFVDTLSLFKKEFNYEFKTDSKVFYEEISAMTCSSPDTGGTQPRVYNYLLNAMTCSSPDTGGTQPRDPSYSLKAMTCSSPDTGGTQPRRPSL